MKDERHRELVEIFGQIQNLPPAERDAFLEDLGRKDDELRRRLDALLRHEREDSRFLERPVLRTDVRAALLDPDASGEDRPRSSGELPPGMPPSIAGYRLVEVLGEGAMGTVFLARQERPERRVALKLVRAGWAGKKLLQRFELEAEVLGRLQHPGIAQIFEAGTFEWRGSSLPYFVMEYIEGRSLLSHADGRDLGPRERLELLVRVCEAVQHAHQKGVVHRDLKPENILVTTSGQPKILDFGVARVTDSDIQLTTIATEVGQLIGTIPYMSPEQTRGDSRALDTRSDVYSLGVIGFELLTGRLPHDVRGKGITEALRVIQHEEPSRLGSLNRRLRGDAETIIGKALEKEKERRYQSAAELGNDIRHLLRNEPIVARPPSTIYQIRKFARRNRGLVGGVVGLFLLSILSAIVTSSLYLRADRERDRAEWKAYVAGVAAAEAALRDGRHGNVRALLGEIPPALRGWEWSSLWNRADPSIATFSGHSGFVQCVAVAPDGLHVYSGAGDATVRMWNPKTGRSRILRGHESGVRALACNPDGSTFASGSSDHTVRLLDAHTLEAIAVLDDHASPVRALAYSPDGRWLVSGAEDGSLRRWDGRTGELLRRFPDGPSGCLSVAFSPDGSIVATGSADGVLRLRNPDEGEIVGGLDGHEDEIRAVAFSPDGRLLASASVDGTARLWCCRSGDCLQVLRGHSSDVLSATFSADGDILLTGSVDQTVRAWQVEGGEMIRELAGHAFAVSSIALLPDGESFVTGSWDNRLKWWRLHSITDLIAPRIREGVTCFAFSPRDDLIALSDAGGHVMLEESRTGKRLAHTTLGAGPIWRMSFASDGSKLAVEYKSTPGAYADWSQRAAGAGGRIAVVDVDSGEVIFDRPGRLPKFSPDGRWLATATRASILVHDADWDVALTLAHPESCRGIYCVAFSPDGRTLASSCWGNGVVGLRSVPGGETIAELPCGDDMVSSIAFSRDGRFLVTAGNISHLRVWSAEDFRLLDEGFHQWLFQLAVSPDCSRLATLSAKTGGDDRADTVKIWRLEPLEELLRIRAEELKCVSFSPGGELLGVGTAEGLVLHDGTNPRQRLARLRSGGTPLR